MILIAETFEKFNVLLDYYLLLKTVYRFDFKSKQT